MTKRGFEPNEGWVCLVAIDDKVGVNHIHKAFRHCMASGSAYMFARHTGNISEP